ncbi:hypothetical protein [Modestobacter caceresii]|jgi:S1-C subfamily serine protease|nr:hypothetical protein [Modestobacter caceresii]
MNRAGSLTIGRFGDLLAGLPAGEPVTVTIRRGDRRQDRTVTPADLPS